MASREEAARAAGKVSLAVLTSRILGLIREQVLAAVFGAGYLMDAWLVAFRIPNMLRDLFAEGALSSAFVPTFTAALQQSRSRAWELANLVFNGLVVILGAVSCLFLFFPNVFVYLVAGGFAGVEGKTEITAQMLRVLSPFVLVIALASVAMGILNAFRHFFLPALAPAIFNVCLILAGLLLAPVFEEAGILSIYAIAVGATVGGLMQFVVQLPLLYREGFRYRPRISFKDPGVRKMATLIAPAVIGLGAVQFNVLVNTQLASLLGDGPVSWLSYAFRLIYLPIGLFGVAVGVVNLREVSVFAARQEWTELKETVANSIKLIGLLALPSTVGLIVLAGPIIEVIFQRGMFTASDTRHTALALICYAVGLVAYSCIKVYVPTFYALEDTRTPVRISLAAVAVNLIVNLTLVFLILPADWAYAGLALGTSFSVMFNNIGLARAFARRVGSLQEFGVGRALVKTGLASIAMGGVVYALHLGTGHLWTSVGVAAKTGRLLFCIGGAGGFYFLLCWLLRVEEVSFLLARIRKR